MLGAPPNLVGLGQIPPLLRGVIARQPPGPDREALERTLAFATFAAENLTLSKTVLQTISQPIAVAHQAPARPPHAARTRSPSWSPSPSRRCSSACCSPPARSRSSAKSTCSAACSAGRVGHSRARGVLVSRNALLAEKSLLAAACAFVVAFAMLAGIGAFVHLDWSRVPLWLAALALARARVRRARRLDRRARPRGARRLAARLPALAPARLPRARPSGSVGHGLYDAISAVSFVFPFKAALQALDAAVNQSSPGLPISLVHLAALVALFGALARVGLRRLD